MILEQSPELGAGVNHVKTRLSTDTSVDQAILDFQSLEASEHDSTGTDTQAVADTTSGSPTEPQSLALPVVRRGCKDVLYTYHRFLSHNQLSTLSARDFNLLDTQNCLRVPTREILDEFVHQYFLYVHPLLPMMDEAEFWRRYRDEQGAHGGISLLLLQAMLFAACNVRYTPFTHLQALNGLLTMKYSAFLKRQP